MMKTYIGTKIIKAAPMTRLAYNTWRGWAVAPEDMEDEGYLVEYTDGGKSNHPDFNGYVSWSPKGVFENTYQDIKGMSFGVAIEAMKLGERVTRSGWINKDEYIRYVPTGAGHFGLEITFVNGLAAFWTPTVGDVLADDWELL